MNQQHTDKEVEVLRDSGILEEALKSVWDKIRAAGNLIVQLREEKQSLAQRLTETENESKKLRAELGNREQELKRVRAEYVQLMNSNGHDALSGDEKENLKNKIRDIIAKINSHL